MFNKSTKLKKKKKQQQSDLQKERRLLKETEGHGDMNEWDRQRKSVLHRICCWEDKSLTAAMHSYEVIPDGAIWAIEMGAQNVRIKTCIFEVHLKFTHDFKGKVKS